MTKKRAIITVKKKSIVRALISVHSFLIYCFSKLDFQDRDFVSFLETGLRHFEIYADDINKIT
jgi:hypothetical protein